MCNSQSELECAVYFVRITAPPNHTRSFNYDSWNKQTNEFSPFIACLIIPTQNIMYYSDIELCPQTHGHRMRHRQFLLSKCPLNFYFQLLRKGKKNANFPPFIVDHGGFFFLASLFLFHFFAMSAPPSPPLIEIFHE